VRRSKRAAAGSGVSFSSVITRQPDRARGYSLLVSGFALAFSASTGCAGESSAHKQCPSEAWVGKCTLSDLRKVEEREMPIPWVVYEATYSPQANAEYPNFMPPETRLRFGAQAKNEYALVDHLKPQALVSCHAASTPGSCLPRDLVADVAPFDPDEAEAAPPPRVTGCAAIDAASEQDRLAKTRGETTAISERFSFGEGSTALAPEATTDATAIAKRMADDPSLECVGLVGQASPGESPSLAEARARAVKRLLVSLGVDSTRLQAIGATASVYGAASVPTAEQRRVSVSVLLKTAEKSGQ
jgi:outer membrane protein OmpA-like peptidoglycan-associated protein